MKFELDFADMIMIGFCLFILSLGSIFLGHEIATVRHSAELRKANHIVMNCQKLISRSIYE
jgi:hypothetical protein